MNKFINKLQRYMQGRYGPDELYRFMLIICLIIIIVNMFVNSVILRILELIVFGLALYRFLSKKKNKRSKENRKYLETVDKIKSFFSYQKKKYQDRNTHMYKKCPKCKQKIRLPLKKGKHTVKCPSCKEKFEVKCNKNEKIKVEIVK